MHQDQMTILEIPEFHWKGSLFRMMTIRRGERAPPYGTPSPRWRWTWPTGRSWGSRTPQSRTSRSISPRSGQLFTGHFEWICVRRWTRAGSGGAWRRRRRRMSVRGGSRRGLARPARTTLLTRGLSSRWTKPTGPVTISCLPLCKPKIGAFYFLFRSRRRR